MEAIFGSEKGTSPSPRGPTAAGRPPVNAVRKVETQRYDHADYIAMRKATRTGGLHPKDKAFVEG